jgi:sulfur relay (sulfurtransferase) DsrC/TusE family protein
MDTLELQAEEIQQNLEGYMAPTQEWWRNADAQFANINKLMQQQQADLQAYFRFQGLNPYQGP